MPPGQEVDARRLYAEAHPGLVCETLAELEATAQRIQSGGYELSWAERELFAGYIRFRARDGFRNRIEIMTPSTSPNAPDSEVHYNQ